MNLNLQPVIADDSKANDRVDVWFVWNLVPEQVFGDCESLLSADEVGIARRFVFEHLRRDYVVSHAVLRVLTAQYMNCAPRETAFSLGPNGKPAILGDTRLRFNMSHSGGLSAYAFALGCEIGIDIEQIRHLADRESIASQNYSSGEVAAMLAIPDPEDQHEVFFRCWTRKEAYVKALGAGLSFPLDQFEVTVLRQDPPRLLRSSNDRDAVSDWTLHHLDPTPGFVGALAYRSTERSLQLKPLQSASTVLGLHLPGCLSTPFNKRADAF